MADSNAITSYRWDAGALIRQVDIRAQGKSGAVAYLQATPEAAANPQALQELRTQFRLKGWAGSSDRRDGRPVLRLTGIGNPDELLELLRQRSAVSGEPHITTSAEKEPAKGVVDAIAKNTLRSSGIFYSIGNALMITSGVLRSKAKGKFQVGQLGSGLSFAAGDIALTVFGGEDDKRQFTSLLTKLKQHLDDHGIEIPQTAAINVETRKQHESFGESVFDFMHQHINTFKILMEIIGGGLYAKGGFEDGLVEKKIAGSVIVAGWLAALMVHEKKTDPEQLKDANWAQRTWAHIQEKPLLLAGGAGLIHNGISAIGTYNERARFLNPQRPNPMNRGNTHFYKWDIATIAAMLLGNSLYSISQKTTGGAIREGDLVDDVYGIAAQILNKQPEEVREAAIAQTASFLGERPEIKDRHGEIMRKLREKMEVQVHNPWFENVPLPPPSAISDNKRWTKTVKRDDAPEAAPGTPVQAATPLIANDNRWTEAALAGNGDTSPVPQR